MDNKDYLKKILSANIHISDKNKLDESLDAMFDGGNGVTSWNNLQDKPFGEGELMLLFPNTNFQLQEVASGTKLGTILFGDIGVEEKRGFKIGDTVIVSTLGKTYEVVATATTNSSLFGAGLPEAVINVTTLARIHIISDTQQAFISEEGGYIILVENVTGNKLNIGAQVYGVKTIDPRYLPTTIPAIQTAQVGQTIIVKSVDENGKPTKWEAIDPHTLTDTETGKKYQLNVVNGKLTMTEVE
jgi:hypothetical protein